MKFLYFLLLILSCSNSSILRKNEYLESLSVDLFLDEMLFQDQSMNDSKMDISYFPLDRQSRELLYSEGADILDKEKIIDIGLCEEKSWYARNKENLNFIYGATILFIVYTTVRWE